MRQTQLYERRFIAIFFITTLALDAASIGGFSIFLRKVTLFHYHSTTFSNFFPFSLHVSIFIPAFAIATKLTCGVIHIVCGFADKIYGDSPSTCFFALRGWIHM